MSDDNPPDVAPPPAVLKRVMDSFLILDAGDFLESMSLETDDDALWASCIHDAAEGLRSVISAASLPFQLSFHAVTEHRFDRFLLASQVRLLDRKDEYKDEQEMHKAASAVAREKMKDFMDSEQGTRFTSTAACNKLDTILSANDIASASRELLVQSIVSTWSVFETFSSSLAIKWLNAHPGKAKGILENSELSKFIGKQPIDFDTLKDHGFDLSGMMGNILFDNRRFDNLQIIRVVMEALFHSADVRDFLGDKMWKLNQRRNLFVHKRGIVDREFLKRTGESFVIGEKLIIRSNDLETSLAVVRDSVTTIAHAAKMNTL